MPGGAAPAPRTPAAGGRAPAIPSGPAGRDRPRLFGFNDNGIRAGQLTAAQDADLTARVGGNASRITMDWRWVEARRGTRDFHQYDPIYRELLARGIQPVWVVAFAPRWALDAGVTCNQWQQECRYPPAPEHLGAWRSFIAEVVKRYPASAAIEVWNEPNLQGFFHPVPDPVRYTTLLAHAYDAVQEVQPEMPVLGGGLGNNQTDRPAGGDVSLATFLDTMYRNGAAAKMDGISFHPYPISTFIGSDSLFVRSFAQVRAIRDRYGDSGKRLWITETGVSTTRPKPAFTDLQQAEVSVAMLRAVSVMPDVEAFMLHTLVEAPHGRPQPVIGYGILRRDLTPKPAYCALARERLAPGCS